MYKDEIISEVWRNRDDYARKHHNCLAEMVADLQGRQEDRGDKVVDNRKTATDANRLNTTQPTPSISRYNRDIE